MNVVLLQGCSGYGNVHYMPQDQKKLPNFALPAFLTLRRVPSAAHSHLSFLPSMQYKGQRAHGTVDNSIKKRHISFI